MTPPMVSASEIDVRPDDPSVVSRSRAQGRGCVESSLLFQGARELVIDHGGNAYHLRITRNDKLILTK